MNEGKEHTGEPVMIDDRVIGFRERIKIGGNRLAAFKKNFAVFDMPSQVGGGEINFLGERYGEE